MRPISLPICFIRNVLLLSCLLVTSMVANAQFVISYPGAAQQDLTVCYGQSTLTVRVDVAAASSNNTVTVQLPTGVNYVAGTVTKTGGTAALTIAESNIANLNAPVFAISPTALSPGDYITFTIARTAGCAARTYALAGNTFKDVTTATGSGGTKAFTPATGYNVNYPSFSLVQPAAITNAVIGATYTRTFTVTNGSSGTTGHVYLYIDYPSAGIALQSLKIGATAITPVSTVGDRTLFDISGALLGADNLFTNGEILTFAEEIKVLKCDATTAYGAGWGCDATPANWCQSATGSSAMTMATGSPLFGNTTATATRTNYVDMCTNFTTTLTYPNVGTGNLAAATMYNVIFRWGTASSSAENLYQFNFNFLNLLSASIGSGNVPIVGGTTAGIASMDVTNLFTTDPDGPGGLADIDGDGYFDDLPPGNTATLVIDTKFNCALSQSCGFPHVNWVGLKPSYTTMCSSVYVNAPTTAYFLANPFNYSMNSLASNSIAPANAFGGVPFNVRFSINYNVGSNFDNSNTRYQFVVTLPAGLSLSGNAIWRTGVYPENVLTAGVPAVVTTTSNPDGTTTLVLQSPSEIQGWCSVDLIYNCDALPPCPNPPLPGGAYGGALDIPFVFQRIDNIATGCSCKPNVVCSSIHIPNIVCTSNSSCDRNGDCIDDGGVSNTFAKVERADNSLGWTDNNLTTRQSRSVISSYDLSKAMYLDDIEIVTNGVQSSVSSNNLFLKLVINKTVGTDNKLTPVSTAVVIKRSGNPDVAATSTTFSLAQSTNAEQIIEWDLSSIVATLPGGVLQPGDIIETKATYSVSSENLPTHDIQTGKSLYLYNKDNLGAEMVCGSVLIPEMYLVIPTFVDAHNNTISSACTSVNVGNGTNYLGFRFDATGVPYVYEVRPGFKLLTYEVTAPASYSIDKVSVPSLGGVVPPHSVNGGTWHYDLPFVCYPITRANYYSIVLHTFVIPSCSSPAYGNPSAQLNTKVEYIPYYYHYVGNPNAPILSNIKNQPINYNETTRPSITLTNQTGTIQAYQPQHNWTVRMVNPSSSTAPYTWLGIPTKAGVNVVSVTDVATGAALTPIAYTGGNWYQISTTGLEAGTFKDYKIDFTYTSCNEETLQVLGGWNCSGFPTDPTTYTCGNNAINLKFIPEISEVELTADAPLPPAKVDLCTLVDYAFHITSSQAANTVHNKVVIDFPTGMHAVQGSFFVEYPLGAGNWKEITPNVGAATPQGIKYTYDLTSATDIYPAQGLPGTLATSVTANRQMGIKFKTTTDCSFVAGTNFKISALADRPCGEPAIGNGLIVQGPSVGINGVNPAYQTINVLTSTDMLNCSQEATITVQSTIIAGTTGANDIMNILLPKGISMVPNSFIQINGGTVTFVSASTDPATGVTVIKYKIPSGLTSGDKMEFSIKVIDGVDSNCGVNRVDVQTKAIFENITCGSSTCPTVGAETGRGGVDFNVKKPDLTLTAVSGCHNAASGGYNVSFTVSNSGTAALLSTGDPLVMKFYCNDGAGNPTGTALATYSQAVDIAIAGTYSGTYSFTSSTACANGVIAVISKDDNCICNTTQKAFAPGAGPATPTVTTTAATCSAAGTATISNYNSVYTYTFSPTGPSVGTGGAITGMTAGTSYTVTAASGTCVSSASASFSVAAQLAGTSLSLSPATQTVCAGQTASVSATVSGGASVNWVSDLGGMTATGNNFTTGALPNKGTLPYTITVTATASNGTCPISEQATITVMPEPRIVISPKSKVVCVKEKVQFSISAIIPGTVINWTLVNSANATLSTGTGIDTATAAVSGLAAGVYTLKVTATKGSCSSQATASLVVN